MHKDPIERTSQNGKAFVTCNLRIEQEGGTVWASVICFDEQARAELLRSNADDTVSIRGKLKVGMYERNGEHRPSLDVIANGVLPAKPKPRPKASGKPYERTADHRAGYEFDDPITF